MATEASSLRRGHMRTGALVCGMLFVCGVAWAGTLESEIPSPVMTIAQALVDNNHDEVPDRLGQRARVRGVVTIPPGELGGKNFVVIIQDSTGGIALFSRTLSVPLQAGDAVEASGEIGQFRGTSQLQRVAVVRVGHTQVPTPVPLPLTQRALLQHLGQRVQVEGTIGSIRLGTFGTLTLTGDGGESLVLYFPARVMGTLPVGLLIAGSRISAIGVSSIYNRSRDQSRSSGLQLIVTEPGRLRLLSPPPPAWHKWRKWLLAGLGLVLVPTAGTIYELRRRRRERERELDTFNALALVLEAPAASQELVARQSCDILIGHRLFDAVAVHSLDQSGRLQLLAASGIDAAVAAEIGEQEVKPRLQSAEPWASFVETSNRPPPVPGGLHLISVLPLSAPGRTTGAMCAFSRREAAPTHIQRRMLLASAKLIALGLANIDIHTRAESEQQKLRELATTDDLTSLYNRRHLNDYLAEQIAAIGDSGKSMAFVAADLDHFKSINDNWGHEAGDKVLVRVSQEIRSAIRASDIAVRYGGEEFLVVAPGMMLEAAALFAERLRARFDQLLIHGIIPGKGIHITVSIGVAVLPLHGRSASDILRACDVALYQSKKNGRNCVTIAAEQTSWFEPGA